MPKFGWKIATHRLHPPFRLATKLYYTWLMMKIRCLAADVVGCLGTRRPATTMFHIWTSNLALPFFKATEESSWLDRFGTCHLWHQTQKWLVRLVLMLHADYFLHSSHMIAKTFFPVKQGYQCPLTHLWGKHIVQSRRYNFVILQSFDCWSWEADALGKLSSQTVVIVLVY